ncbi:putative reverse transcriptase domain-containing protein, partial [Tanacetum coccineum]
MTITRSDMNPKAIEELVNRRVEEALAAHEATRATNDLEAIKARMTVTAIMETAIMEMVRMEMVEMEIQMRMVEVIDLLLENAHTRTSMKCQPLNFKGTKGVVGLIRWFENMETVFHIRNCLEKYQVKELMKLMVEVYCLRNEIQKMESKLWNLTVKNNDLAAYTQRFQKLTMMCTKMVLEEEDQVEKFIGGLPDNIQGNVIVVEPTKLQDVVRIANNLMDQKLKGYAVQNAKNKRRLEVNQRDNCGQQPSFKRPNVGGQNVARAYTAGNNERKP